MNPGRRSIAKGKSSGPDLGDSRSYYPSSHWREARCTRFRPALPTVAVLTATFIDRLGRRPRKGRGSKRNPEKPSPLLTSLLLLSPYQCASFQAYGTLCQLKNIYTIYIPRYIYLAGRYGKLPVRANHVSRWPPIGRDSRGKGQERKSSAHFSKTWHRVHLATDAGCPVTVTVV